MQSQKLQNVDKPKQIVSIFRLDFSIKNINYRRCNVMN